MPPEESIRSPDSAAVFRQSWQVYEKFVTHNWMRHREVYAALRGFAERVAGEALAVADFGCGDGSCTLKALSGLPLRRYIAIDRVPALLETIPAQLANRECNVELIEADLSAAAARPPAEPVSIVLAAYSVHHLGTAEKQNFLRNIARWSSPGGRLVIIDLLRRREESRRQYLDRFHRHAMRCFRGFSHSDQQLVREHMEEFDFPETLPTLQQICVEAGLTLPHLIYRDPQEFYAVLTWRTP